MDFSQKITLGRTGLQVGRLGISSSYGAKANVFEEAYERGCNYLTWGTFIKGDSSEMKKAIRNLIARGQRDKMVISVFTYAHDAFLTRFFLERRLKALGTDHIDILLLGYFPKVPPQRVLDGARKLKERGLIRHIGMSSHHRPVFQKLKEIEDIDVFHVRYNAAHSGAEKDVFPYFKNPDRPGIVGFTATRWENLLNPKKTPPDEAPLTPQECYRFVLSNPAIDVCMMGIRNIEQMRENIQLMELGSLDKAEMARVRRVGNYVHRH